MRALGVHGRTGDAAALPRGDAQRTRSMGLFLMDQWAVVARRLWDKLAERTPAAAIIV